MVYAKETLQQATPHQFDLRDGDTLENVAEYSNSNESAHNYEYDDLHIVDNAYND